MPLIPKPNYNQIFASQAPDIDKPSVFNNYPEGWGPESRPNNGKPTIKGFNYLQQASDLKDLWILQNGACLPYDESIEYAEGAPVLKDGVIQYKTSDGFVNALKTHNDLDGRDAAGAHPASAIKSSNGEDQQQINDSLIRIVSNKTDLLTINSPRNKQVAYVTENEKRYIYNPSLSTPENGVTVVGKWEMEIQEAYYASWFCESESGVDESVKLRVGYAYATSKKRSFIIDIKLDVLPTISGDYNGNKTVIKILDNSCLIFKQGLGQLRLIPNSLTNHYLISTYQAKNFAVFDADLIGDRLTHNYSSGGTHEWGYGIAIYECENGHFHKPRVSNMTGDGIYIGKSWGDPTDVLPTNITIVNPIIERVRRNGLSLTSAKNLFVESLVSSNVGTSDGVTGTDPMSGLDVEPESQSPMALKLINCRFNNTTISDCTNGMDVTIITGSSVNADLAFTGITKIVRSENKHLSLVNTQTETDGEILFDDLRLVGSPSVADIMWGWLETSLKLRFKNVSKIDGDINFSVRGNVASLFSDKCGGTSLNITNTPLRFGLGWLLEDTVLKITSLVVKSNTNIVSSTYPSVSYDEKANIEGEIEINNGSVSTEKLPVNSLNASLYAGGPCVVTLNDTRIFEIKKLANSDASALLEITGFNFTNNTSDTFTKISTSTLGGYVRLCKKVDGSLEILEMRGVWTFS